MTREINVSPLLPYKSNAIALIFALALGPIGLLYATFWGGLTMILAGFVVLFSKNSFAIFLYWLICPVWATAAIELYNRKIYRCQLS